MTDKQTYAFMAAAAYDERRGSESDDHVMAIKSYLNKTMGWSKEDRTEWNNADGASYSDYPASGMQADVWTKGTEYVIAFRGTEGSRAGSNDGFRSGDGLKGTSTLDGKINHFAPAL